MRDGELRHSFEMSDSDMFSTASASSPDLAMSSGRTQAPIVRHLWHQSASFESSTEDLSAETEAMVAPSKAERRAVAFAAASGSRYFDDSVAKGIGGGDASEEKDSHSKAAGAQAENNADEADHEDEDVSPTAASDALEQSFSSDRREDIVDEVASMPKLRPKKFWTHESALVRSRSREGWDVVLQQPFQSRQFLAKQLEGWTPVNVGQLLGFASHKGGQPRVANQDEYVVLHEAGYQIYLVIDGYGEGGEVVARFSRRWLVTALLSLVRQRDGRVLANGELTALLADLNRAALNVDASMELAWRNSGCAVTVVVVTPTRSLRGAWLGPCQCIVGGRRRGGEARSLTPPHSSPPVPGMPSSATRAIGHFSNENLGHEAEEFVEADLDHAEIDFLVIGSGGFWRGVSKEFVAEEISKAGPYYAQHACSRIATSSQDNQMRASPPAVGPMGVEDATVILAWIGGNLSGP